MKNVFLIITIAILIAGCGRKEIDSFFEPSLMEGGTFLAVPFPNELYLDENGRINLLKYFKVEKQSLLKNYLEDISNDTDWFGLNPVVYFWFSNQIDTSSLPHSPEESIHSSSPIVWLNVQTGEILPFMWKYYERKTKFLPSNVLAILLYPGFTLKEENLYAVYVKNSLDERIKRPELLDDILRGRCALKYEICDDTFTAIEKYTELFGKTDFITLTVFRTGKPTSRLEKLIDEINSFKPPFLKVDFKGIKHDSFHGISGEYYLFEITFPVPLFQKGEPPYIEGDSGYIEYLDGRPVIQNWETGRMVIAVPTEPVPADGYPVLLYGHGTGGDAWSFVRDGSALNITQAGCAGVGIDEPLHGIRGNSSFYPYLFFNFLNLKSARDNVLQGAGELAYYTSILENIRFRNPQTNEDVFFDRGNIYYMGHSQGAIIGVPFLGIEERIKSAVISGGGGFLTYSLMFKSLPFEVKPLIERFIVGEEVDEFNIMLSLFQHFFEPADSINYIGKITSLKSKAKNLFVSEGLLDEYTPPQTAEAMITAGNIPLLEPIFKPIKGLEIKGIESISPPTSCNYQIEGECFTILAVQFPDYGHFAVFESEEAFSMWREFIATSRDKPTVSR